MEHAAATFRKTPLHARHRALNARMIPFAGWDMPLEYTGIADEHLAVRSRAGLFDVSHIGEIEVAGADALAGLQGVTCNDAAMLGSDRRSTPPSSHPRAPSWTTCSSTAWPRATT